MQLSVGGGVYSTDRAQGTKKGPREAPADRVERSRCPSEGSHATWINGATSGPALWAGEGRNAAVGVQCGDSFHSASYVQKRPRRKLRRDASDKCIRAKAN